MTRLPIAHDMPSYRAYVVHAHPEQVKTDAAKVAFQQSVRKWTQGKVARHKFLRGGLYFITPYIVKDNLHVLF